MSELLNPWNYKPWWCQPWSILLTGMLIVGGTWLIFRLIWVTVLVAFPIGVWWIYFLILWPRLIREGRTSGILTGETSSPSNSPDAPSSSISTKR